MKLPTTLQKTIFDTPKTNYRLSH